MTSDIAIVIACPYHQLTEVFIEYVRSVDISDISSEVELILARASMFPSHVIFLRGQSD